MRYILTSKSVTGARYYANCNGDLAMQECNAWRFYSWKDADEARKKFRAPQRDMFGVRLRGFSVETV